MPGANESTPVSARGLVKRYGEILAVDAVDLNVEPGDIYGFLGPNGAGKTTAMRMLLGLLRPDSGEVRLFGRDPQHELPEALDGVAGFVETPRFYGYLTGRKNLELCTRVSVIRAGAIVYEGSLAELHASASPRYRLRTSDHDTTEAILIGDGRVREPAREGDELVFDADESTVLELSRALAAAGIGIAALVPETATLERLFFELTQGEPHPHRLEAVA